MNKKVIPESSTVPAIEAEVTSDTPNMIVPDLPTQLVANDDEFTDPPTLMVPIVEKRLLEIQKQISQMGSSTPDESVISSITEFHAMAIVYSQKAVSYSEMALVAAWGCGALLNAAKRNLPRGAFGPWRKTNFKGFSVRSSTRYMQFAKRFPNIRPVLESGVSLRKAYITCGVLLESDASDRSGGKKKTPTVVLLKGVRNCQKSVQLFTKSLDRFKGSNETLSPEQKEEIYLMKAAIGNFMQRINELLP